MVYPATPLEVEVGLNLGGTWVNATTTGGGVLHSDAISVALGRSNWAGEADPARLGFTLRDTDGRWSPDLVTGAHYGLYHRNIPTRLGVGLGEPYLMPTGVGADLASTPNVAAIDLTGDLDLRADVQLNADLVDTVRGGARARLAHKSNGTDGWEWDLANTNGRMATSLTWRDAGGTPHTVSSEGFTESHLPLSMQHDRGAVRVTLDVDTGGGASGVDFWNVYDVDNSIDSPTRTTTALGYTGAFPITRSQLDGILDTWVAGTGGTTRNVANTTDWTNAMAAAVPGDLIRITTTITSPLTCRGNKYSLPGHNLTASPAGGTTSLPIIITCADGVYIDPNNQSNNTAALDISACSHVWAIGVNVKRSQFGLRCMLVDGTLAAPVRIAWCDIRDMGHSGLIMQGWFQLIATSGGTPPAGTENTWGYSSYILAEANTVDSMGNIASQFGECVYMGNGSNHYMARAHHIWLRYNTLRLSRADYVDIKPGCHQIYVYGNIMKEGGFNLGAAIQILYLDAGAPARPAWYDFDPEVFILYNRIYDGNITNVIAGSSNYAMQASIAGVRVAFNLIWGFSGGGIGLHLRSEVAASNSRTTGGSEKWWVVNNLMWTTNGLVNGGAPAASPVAFNSGWIDSRNNLGFTTTTGVQFVATSSDFTNPGTIPAVGAVTTADWNSYGPGSAFDMAAGSSLVGDGTGISDLDLYINDLDISQRAVPASAPNPGAYMVAATGSHTATFWSAPTIAGPWTAFGAQIIPGTTTVKASTAALRVGGNPGDGLHIPLPGRFNAFELRSTIGGTVVANPTFTAQAIGATSFTDGAGRAWTIGTGGRITNMRWRFHGELASLPVRWDLSGKDVTAPVEATGLFRRLRQGDRVLESALRRATVRSAPGLVQYWPCEDDGVSLTQFGAAVGTAPLLVYAGGSPKTATNSDFPSSSPLPSIKGTAWAAWVDSYPVTAEWQVRWLMSVPDGTTAADEPIFRIETTSGLIFELHYQDGGGGNLKLDVYKAGALAHTSGWVAFQTTGRPMRMHLECTTSGANISYRLLGQPVGVAAAGIENINITTGTPGAVSLIIVNQNASDLDIAAGHVTIQDTATDTAELTDGLNAHTGEKAGTRIQRLCLEEGIAFRIQGDPTDTEPMGPQRALTLPDLLQECAATDGGLLAEARDSVAVAYRTRTSMQSQTPLTLNYSAGELPGTPELDRDDQGFANDITVTSAAGGIGRAVLTDPDSPMSIAEPPGGAGRYAVRYEANCLEARAADLAGWRLRLSAVDEPRVSRLSLETNLPAVVASPTLTQSVLDLALGDLVKVTGLPTNVMTGSIRQIVQGVRETITMFGHRIDMLTSPASPWDARQVDVDARYDTASSILAAAAAVNATSISVATLLGPAWVTAGAEFPFDITVGGVRVTVSAIGAVSGGLQTFTISPLPIARDVGFPVQLADPAFYEL